MMIIITMRVITIMKIIMVMMIDTDNDNYDNHVNRYYHFSLMLIL